MDHIFMSKDVDNGVWDELHHEQSREIQQHLNQRNQTGFLHQTFNSIYSVAERAASSFHNTTNPIRHVDESPTLSEFGLYPDEPLLQGMINGDTYEEFSNHTAQRGGFIFLDNFRLPKSEEDTWGAVSNLDLFFMSLYNYYYQRGLMPILGKGIVELVSLLFTLWLSVVIFALIDWTELIKCKDEQTCKPRLSDYLIQKPFSHASLWNFIVILYCILFTVYGIFSLWSFWQTIQDSLVMKSIFENRLGISEQRLEGGAVDWDRDVVSKLISLQNSGEYQILIHGQANLDALYIAQRILRKDNFMVAFFNRGMLDLQVPFIPFQDIYCKSLEWAIYFCIQNYMFNHKFQVRPGFYLDPKSLKRRFFLCGIAHAVFLPFLTFFMLLHFLMQNGYDWKAKKQYLGPKEWSLAARWTFREFNELPHFFERRLEPSYEATEEYLKLFRQNEIMTTIGRIFVFIGGAFASVLFAFAAVNDAILLHIKIGNFNLLWFVGVATMCYSIGKSMLPDPEAHTRNVWNLNEELERALNLMATHTHYYPDTWKGKGYDMRNMLQVKRMFTNKTSLFVHELISLLLAPLVLCFSLPRCAEHICEFVMTVKADVPGAGEICGYATFDFDAFGDHSFEGKTLGEARGAIASSIAELQNVETTTRLHPKPKAYHGKMEKSFFSFKACHPSWTSTKSGQTLIDRVELFKQNEMKALVLEQQQHLEAAVRQIDTLENIEKRNTEEPSPMINSLLNNYIGLNTPLPFVAEAGGSAMAGSVNISLDEYTARLSSALLSSQHGMRSAKYLPHRLSTDSKVATADLQTSLIYEKVGIPLDRSSHHEDDPDEQQRHQEQVQYMWLQQYHSQQDSHGNQVLPNDDMTQRLR